MSAITPWRHNALMGSAPTSTCEATDGSVAGRITFGLAPLRRLAVGASRDGGRPLVARPDNSEVWAFIWGVVIGLFIFLLLVAVTGMSGNHRFVRNHSGIEDRIEQEEKECKELPDVAECKWDSDTHEFVEESD